MRLLIDQNLSPLIAEGLVAKGHDAVHTAELGLATADDGVILQRATAENRVIVSADTDFGDLLVLHGTLKPPIVLIRRSQIDGRINCSRCSWSTAGGRGRPRGRRHRRSSQRPGSRPSPSDQLN